MIDEIGFERLTTAMVAERAGASIGTVYRYFPDRIAVVEALAIRSTQRLAERFLSALDESGAGSWQEACDALVDATVEMYRTEPGFRAIRFGDAADTGSRDAEDRMAALGAAVSQVLHDRFGFPAGERVARTWVVLAESAHAVIARAMRDRSAPDTALIEEYRTMSRAHLEAVVAAS
ncbi:TetR family transcriptional regulator [Curtobacterium sp. ER1/6]|uniref:TetR/AcrR family transcriptional regulator n=1 Tax=Curtobacterium sp. ER1/6 TaxID=1891920 RepID=UPI00167097B6